MTRVVREGGAEQPQSEEVVAHYSVAAGSLNDMCRSLYQQVGAEFLNFARSINAPVSPAPIAEVSHVPRTEQAQTLPNNVIQFPLGGRAQIGGFAVTEAVASEAPVDEGFGPLEAADAQPLAGVVQLTPPPAIVERFEPPTQAAA